MKDNECFWIFGSLGLGDHIVCNALYRHYAELHKDKFVIIPIWEHNLSAVQWMLSDIPNIFFYPLESESQLFTCQASVSFDDQLSLGFYNKVRITTKHDLFIDKTFVSIEGGSFNPVIWDSEFYRQAGLDPELKWKGFKLPELYKLKSSPHFPIVVCHEDKERGFGFRHEFHKHLPLTGDLHYLSKEKKLEESCAWINSATEIHCIDSSMLNLSDLMETPYCKRFVFHRYARKGLPPQLKKAWEILD